MRELSAAASVTSDLTHNIGVSYSSHKKCTSSVLLRLSILTGAVKYSFTWTTKTVFRFQAAKDEKIK